MKHLKNISTMTLKAGLVVLITVSVVGVFERIDLAHAKEIALLEAQHEKEIADLKAAAETGEDDE